MLCDFHFGTVRYRKERKNLTTLHLLYTTVKETSHAAAFKCVRYTRKRERERERERERMRERDFDVLFPGLLLFQ